MRDYIKVKLGGKERGLKFNMGTLYHLGQITEKDPLKQTSSENKFTHSFSTFKNIVHAALLSNCDSKGVEPDFSSEDVLKWCKELSAEEANVISTTFTKCYEGEKATGEGGKDTQ